MNIVVKKASTNIAMQACLQIRKIVFVEEQNVPLHEELDGKDGSSEHYLLYVDAKPCGTARIQLIGDYAKIERVAILADYRGKKLGVQLMQQIVADLESYPLLKKAKLSAQLHAISFYEKLGFRTCSETYMDAGIPHKDMILALN